MISEYKSDNKEHEHNLTLLYKKSFKTEEIKSNENQHNLPCVNDDWKDIGFQGVNPRTDFRAGGHLSLLCLLYLVENYEEEWAKLA